ncbi:uncharacterized protein G2W53_031248 [Senna tora]|uniref:Uncharacterized protein n=1 Tax=Senna tora TaxID=362788 RepID=A0A834WHK4_9FABA|nr:uncharacterized protein G2W53_031248 [Senna tora]
MGRGLHTKQPQPRTPHAFFGLRESSLTLRHKLKSSICCFSHAYAHHHGSLDDADLYYKTLRSPMPCGSWRKKSPSDESSEPRRGRSRCLLSRIGRKHRRYSQSADFSYDPSSYALNFEDDCRADDEEFPFRDFASRFKPLPSSTPTSPPPPAREIVGLS